MDGDRCRSILGHHPVPTNSGSSGCTERPQLRNNAIASLTMSLYPYVLPTEEKVSETDRAQV
jgi:hypothetical protein